jgi:hypothetical protein
VPYRTSDIIVCAYGLFSDFVGGGDRSLFGRTKVEFASMILDLRYPHSSNQDEKLSKKEKDQSQNSKSLVESVRWWLGLNSFLAKRSTNMKRLLIEQKDFPQCCIYPPDSEGTCSRSAEQTKRFEKLLAMKVAFFYHPSVFFSKRHSVGKRVISWAKSEAMKKISIRVTAHGITLAHILSSGNGAESASGYRSVLMASLKSNCDTLVEVMGINTNQTKDLPNEYQWQLRTCLLAKPQQDAYNQSHPNLRGPDDEIADGLMRLRKICLHSNLDKILETVFTPLRFRLRNGQSYVGRSGSILVSSSKALSEPRFDVARKVMKKSSKMKELLGILILECGIDIADEFDLKENIFDVDDNNLLMNDGPKKKSKILILATLVEAQLLTSYFLSAVGLQHEVLLSLNANDHAVHSSFRESETAWTWSQDVLSRFNNVARSDGHRSINILVSSPGSISSHSGGIGVASADIVISIDEDWSGREAIHIKSIMTNMNMHQRRTMGERASSRVNSPFKFVKIVCQNTFEEIFLCRRRPTNNDGEKKHEKEAQQQLNISTRRSSRQSQRILIRNQDEAVPGTAKNNQNCPTKLGSSVFFCPIRTIPTTHSINGDGFLVPPAITGNVGPLRNVDNFHSTESSLTTIEFASDFCSLNSASNSCHFSTKNELKNSTIASDRTEAFSWALFNNEDRASSLPIGGTGKRPEVNLELRSIIVSRTARTVPGSNYIRRYVESFKNSSSFIQHRRGEKLISVLNKGPCDGVSGNIQKETPSNAHSNSKMKVTCKKEAISNVNNDALLLYSPVGDFTSERGQRNCLNSFKPSVGDLALRFFSVCFSSINSSSGQFEPFSYFPAFLSHIHQENLVRGLRRSIPTSKYDDAVIETSRCSFREDPNQYGNAELTFHRRLLAADLQGAMLCQQRPALNCMILISQKKHQLESNVIVTGGIVGHIPSPPLTRKIASNPGKKSVHKKIKRLHLPDSSAAQDEITNSYFRNDHLITHISAVRDGMKFNITAAALARIRTHGLLHDLILNSLSHSMTASNQLPVDSEHQSQMSVPFPIQTTRSVLLGTIPCVDMDIIRNKQSYLGGITLPVGVESCRTLQQSSEDPWSPIEDSALQHCVLRYGTNWNLAAKAVTSGMTFPHSRLVEGKECVRKAGRRSAVQCKNRWMTLESNKVHAAPSSSPVIVKCTTPTIDPIDRDHLLSVTAEGRAEKEASYVNRSMKEPNQSCSLLWLGSSSSAPGNSDFSPSSKEKRLAIVSRVQILNAASKKRRVINTAIPTFTQAHASHSDAIQAARASMLSAANGVAPPRHEMWPLELLDFRRQHIASTNQNLSRGSTPHPTHPPSHSPSRKKSSAPHHSPHNSQHQIHYIPGQMPDQHQLYQQGQDRANPNASYPQQRHQH